MLDAWEIGLWSAGNLIAIFIAYYVARHFKYNVKTQQELTWEKNRDSIIWWSLSTIDNETIHMTRIFSTILRNNLDFNQDQLFIGAAAPPVNSHLAIEHEISRLPNFSNALGFMTHPQYLAVRDYLGYSLTFARSLENGFYEKVHFTMRAVKAREILNLFPEEIEKHDGLKEWRERFDLMTQDELNDF